MWAPPPHIPYEGRYEGMRVWGMRVDAPCIEISKNKQGIACFSDYHT